MLPLYFGFTHKVAYTRPLETSPTNADPWSGRKTQTQRKLKNAVGSFKFDSVLPTECGIFVPVRRSESNSGNNKREP
jgi:hypothetical protein